jgi:hypothetical protein
MIKKVLLILLCLCLVHLFKAQAPSKFYTKFGGFGIDEGFSITETYDKHYALCGSTSSYGFGATDAFIIVIDSMGQKLWEKNYGGALTDVATSILFNPADSGYFFAGYSNSIGNGGYDVYVARTDKQGNLLWQTGFGGNDWDFGRKMIFANDGNLIICGKTYSKSYGKSDAYLIKVNQNNGNLIWEKHFGGNNNDEFKSVSLTPDGFIVAAGKTESYGDEKGDIFIMRTNLNGDSLFSKTYGLIGKEDFANNVVIENSSTYILGGGSESYAASMMDAYIFKISSNGDSLWLRNYGNTGLNQEATDVFFINNTAGTYAIAYSDENFAFFKRDPKGLILNNQGYYITGNSFGENEDEELYHVTQTSDKGFIGVGYTESYGSQLKDVYVVKFDSVFSYGGKLINVNKHIFNNKTIKVYPTLLTQTNSEIIIDAEEDLSYTLLDLRGRVIIDENTTNKRFVDKTKVDTKNLENGLYILNLKQNNQIINIRIIKN